ncbi:ABC transporter ATP-binding protein [Bacillus gaemokensis]|uniref:ABC transporter ATP-binding protein n=1 Tax=Bacillus gaemokensis TaxID=574375 RepID=A0A073KEL0_9BACI|nr:ABC transporter ATP-binding protein [Bacillus gaemokensis]KEK24985.1 ABC transporter ATP-binding protein [Bacillus gaemokensis]KYG32624.1 ABC transporter ATP-binding protein [Bacillus gaemokensis]
MYEKKIEVQNISKTLSKRKVIKDVTFEVCGGDICGFIGPNGAGKTTIMKMITGLIKPDEGRVIVDGVDVSNDREEALSGIGAMIETPVFFEYMSGRKNLRNLARLNHDRNRKEQLEKVEEVLSIVGLTERGDDKVKAYSLGMKQRLGIAQALLNNPSIVILDEPANGLDPIGMKELRELITSLKENRGITFFISSHLLDELQKICTKYVFIKEGSIKWTGDHGALLNSVGNGKSLETVFMDLMA